MEETKVLEQDIVQEDTTPKKKYQMDFKIFNKKIQQLYKDESSLNIVMGHSVNDRTYFRLTSKSDLDTLMANAYGSPERAAAVSRTMASFQPNYNRILSYFADMHYIRYTTFPVLLDVTKTVASKEYLELYNGMMGVVDGATLEVVIPDLLLDMFLNGSAYTYAVKNTSSQTIAFIALPVAYCRTVAKTNLATNIIQFDLSYFDSFRGDDKEVVLDSFPKEFRKLYTEYTSNTTLNWLELNPKLATSFEANEFAMPPFLESLSGIMEFNGFRANELLKSSNALKSIFTHRIPLGSDDEPIFSIEEVTAIQKQISKIVKKHEGLETITVWGETDLLQLQKDGERENKQVKQAYETIFNTAGLNANIFAGSTAEVLKLNTKIDQAYVWKFITKIQAFMNVAINNLYKFKPYQAEVNILPITVANEAEQITTYRENANFGLGRIDAFVATGAKQKHLGDRFRLEQELKLEEILIPLQSAHTGTGTDTDNAKGKNDNESNKEVKKDTSKTTEE